jgi:virginiamycin A acetyltransferase
LHDARGLAHHDKAVLKAGDRPLRHGTIVMKLTGALRRTGHTVVTTRRNSTQMLDAVKKCAVLLCCLLVSPLILLSRLDRLTGNRQLFFDTSAQFLALIPGIMGVYLRAGFYFATLDRCSWTIHLGFGSCFSRRGASIGRSVTTSAYCVLGDVEIGDEVLIGSRVSITSGKRHHPDEGGQLSRFSDIVYEKVTIGAHSWKGEGSIVMADIRQGSMVAAGSVVSNPMPINAIVGGNPARVLKTIDRTSTTSDS